MPFPLFRKTPKTFSDIVFFTYFAGETRISNINQIQLIMKKILLIAAMVLGFAVAASAQPRAIGARLGNGGEVSYQHQLGANFLEVDGGLGLGFDGTFNVGATGVYNFMIAQPNWTDRGEWGVYAGPGAAVGFGFGEVGYFNVGVAGQVGLEYTFWFPLQLSVDLRPQLGLVTASTKVEGETYRASSFGLWGWYPTLAVRYRF